MLAALGNPILPNPEDRLEPAVENDSKSHNDLLLLATDRFCHAGEYDRLTVNQYTQAFYMLAEHASEFTAQVVARSLARCEATPRSIILYLGMQPISVATPILKHAPQLTQVDIAKILEEKGIEHARSLSTRADIGPQLVQRLKEKKDAIINANLNGSANPLTAPTIERTKSVARREVPLPNRATAPAQAATLPADLQPNVHTTHKQKHSEELGPIAAAARKKLVASAAEEKLLAAAARGGRLDTASEAVQATVAPDSPAGQSRRISAEHFADAFEKCARTNSRQAMTVLMRERFGLMPETAQQIFDDRSGDTLGVLLKSNGIDSAGANRILMCTFPEIGLSIRNAKRAIRFYSQLSQSSCLKAVAQWPKADDAQPRYQSYLADTDKGSVREQPATRTAPGEAIPAAGKTGTG